MYVSMSSAFELSDWFSLDLQSDQRTFVDC